MIMNRDEHNQLASFMHVAALCYNTAVIAPGDWMVPNRS